MAKREITREDILSMDEYGSQRADRRRALTELKRARRVSVGPDATFYFENYDTMWHQIHEMLFIEKGGEAQIPDELEAYNPLIPQGRSLVATVMFEIPDPVRRHQFLSGLGGVEETMTLSFDGEEITGQPEEDVDRTTADGKASSVQFVTFHFTDAQAEKFQAADKVTVGIGHKKYSHMAVLTEEAHKSLAGDLD